jgi:hypothetical protein
MAFSIDESLVGKIVKTKDGLEIGKVSHVTSEDIIVREGRTLMKKVHYLIPKDSIERVNVSDEVINLKLMEPEVKDLEVDIIERDKKGGEEDDENDDEKGVGNLKTPDLPPPPTLTRIE